MRGLFASSATTSLVAKNRTKNYLSRLKTDLDVYGVKWPYQSAKHYRTIYKWCHCLPCGKNWTKKLSQPFENGFWCSRCLNNHFEVLDMIESFANSATASLAAKNGTKKLSQPFQDRFWFSRCLNDHIYEYSPKQILCIEMGFIGVLIKPVISLIFLI